MRRATVFVLLVWGALVCAAALAFNLTEGAPRWKALWDALVCSAFVWALWRHHRRGESRP